MPSTMRFAGVNQYQPSDTSIITEAYSLGVQPAVRFATITDNRTFGFTQPHAKMSVGISVYSSDGTKANAYWASRLEDNVGLDPLFVSNTTDGPGVLDAVNDTIYRQSVVSADTNNLYVQRAFSGFEFPNTAAYHANVWAGSFSGATAQGDLSDVVSSALTLTYGFQPDLIFAFGQYGAAVSVFETTVWRSTTGVWDCVNSKAQFMGAMAWTFSNTTRFPVVHSDEGWFNARFNPVGFRSAVYLGSVGATGATFVVNTAFNTLTTTTGFTTAAFKFHDTAVHWKLWQIYVDASTAGFTVNTIQTNSLIPLWGYFMGSQMRSMNTIGSSADPANGNFGIGFWTGTSNAHGQATILIQDERFNQNNANFVGSSTFINLFDFDGGTTWFCRSGVSGNNGFSFSAYTNTPGDHNGSVMQYLMVGDSVDAPAHLADASGSSIFLADASDYDDNLLLVDSIANIYVGSTYCSTLTNGGFETGDLTGWTTEFGTPLVVNTTGYNVPEGSHFLVVGSNSTYSGLYQDYTIPLSSNVQSGNLSVRVQYQITDLTADSDYSRAALVFIDSLGEQKAVWAHSLSNSRDDTWEAISSDLCPIPADTNKIRIYIQGYKNTGTQLSAYMDDFRLCFTSNSLWTHDVSPLNKDFNTLDTQSWNVTTGTILVRSTGTTNNIRQPIPGVIYGSAVAYYGLNQTVEISSVATLFENWIDVGSAVFNYKYQMNHFAGPDLGLVGVRFWDANSTVVGSYAHVASPFTPGGTLLQDEFGYHYAGSATIPASTRYVTYDCWGIRNDGSNLDAYITGINGWISVNSPLSDAPPPPSSSGPTAGALFRSQPVTDNRDFPTPLTNVRVFPSD